MDNCFNRERTLGTRLLLFFFFFLENDDVTLLPESSEP